MDGTSATDMLKYILAPVAAIFCAAFAFFYKHWTEKIEVYQERLYSLKWLVEKNLFLLRRSRDTETLAALEYLPAFTINKFPAIDNIIRQFISWCNREYFYVQHKSLFPADLALNLSATLLDIIEIYLSLINNYLNKSPMYYYITIFILNRTPHSHIKQIESYCCQYYDNNKLEK